MESGQNTKVLCTPLNKTCVREMLFLAWILLKASPMKGTGKWHNRQAQENVRGSARLTPCTPCCMWKHDPRRTAAEIFLYTVNTDTCKAPQPPLNQVTAVPTLLIGQRLRQISDTVLTYDPTAYWKSKVIVFSMQVIVPYVSLKTFSN